MPCNWKKLSGTFVGLWLVASGSVWAAEPSVKDPAKCREIVAQFREKKGERKEFKREFKKLACKSEKPKNPGRCQELTNMREQAKLVKDEFKQKMIANGCRLNKEADDE